MFFDFVERNVRYCQQDGKQMDRLRLPGYPTCRFIPLQVEDVHSLGGLLANRQVHGTQYDHLGQPGCKMRKTPEVKPC